MPRPKGVINPAIGRRLAMIRERRGFSKTALAAALGVTRHAIAHYERGRADICLSRLEQLADALHVHLEDLLACEDAPLPGIKRGRPPKRLRAPENGAPTRREGD